MKLLKFFTKKRIIYLIVFLVIVAVVVFARTRGNVSDSILSESIKKQDIKRTVLATGQVTSDTDLALSFQSSGTVGSINVKVGDKVESGKVLASLNQRDKQAAVTQARGAWAQAEANYEKVLNGATSEDVLLSQSAVASAQATLDNAKASYDAISKQQEVAVSSAHLALLNSTLAANPEIIYDSALTVTVSGAYSGSQEGSYKISLLSGGGPSYFYYQVSGLEQDSKFLTRGVPLALGTKGLYITFSAAGSLSEINRWSVAIPNTQASTYVTNYNAYQTALQTQAAGLVTARNTINAAETALEQAKAQLVLKQAAARPEDVASAKAAVVSAAGSLAAVEANLENTLIRAPLAGTITKIDLKTGEQASALTPVITLQDVSRLHIEANVSEASIASVKVGQNAEVSLDALGPDKNYTASVASVDPASTVISGVVNYKVTFSLPEVPEIKPGMTANLSVLTESRSQVIAIPFRAIINQDGKKVVRVITDQKQKTYKEVEVKTGMDADGGLVEITSGLQEGQEVVTFIKK